MTNQRSQMRNMPYGEKHESCEPAGFGPFLGSDDKRCPNRDVPCRRAADQAADPHHPPQDAAMEVHI